MKIDKKDKLLLYHLQFEFPLTCRPYLEIGKRLSLSENEIIKRAQRLKKQGIVKYVGALFNFKKLGFESTLAALRVPRQRIKSVAKIINSFPDVSHNYLRDDEEFNLWFTVTVPRGQMMPFLNRIKKEMGIKKMITLKSKKSFKLDTRVKLNENKSCE